MTMFVIITASVVLSIFIAMRLRKSKTNETSIDLIDTLAPETDVHVEIAKRAEEIKAQTKIKSKPKTKKKATPKKVAVKKKVQPKKRG